MVLLFQINTNSYFLHWLRGYCKCTSTTLFLQIAMKTMTKKFQLVNNLFSKQVDGIHFTGYHLTEKFAQNFHALGHQLSLLGQWMLNTSTKCQYRLQASNRWCCYTVGKTQQENCFCKWPIGGRYQWKIRLSGYKEALKAKNWAIAKGLCLNPSTVTMKVTTWQNESLRQKQQLLLWQVMNWLQVSWTVCLITVSRYQKISKLLPVMIHK